MAALSFLLFFPPPTGAQESAPSQEPLVGRLLTPDTARLVVRREPCRCQPLGEGEGDVLLLTIGVESVRNGAAHFHPLGTLAFDRSLRKDDTGQWMGMWIFGPSAPGWRRTVRAFLPLPVGAPTASEAKLEALHKRLEEIRQNPDEADLVVPTPVVDLATLGRYSRSQGIWGGIRRGLSWANVFNPAQFVYRAYLVRRKDRRERQFQRAYVTLQWLLDLEFDGEEDLAWLDTLNELRFHLLRNRSFFGSWLEHADGLELVYDYESTTRVKLGKSSSWLQSAANEHYLRYQPIYRYTTNGAPYPMGGVLYYDPRLGAQPDPGWWAIANPFDLPYNPHTDARVQRLAEEYPEELIPLAIYTFQTDLALRPIIVVDFFSPGNPRTRESTQQLMILAKQWLAIATGPLSLERWPYRVTAWAANKKGYTLLVDKSSRVGIEELRLALEAGLYFDAELHTLLLKRADQRVLNPLIKAGLVEERLAHIQYESLRAHDNRALCKTLNQVRAKILDRLDIPEGLAPEAQQEALAQRLHTWRQQRRLADFVSQGVGDFGSLRSLEEPLGYFLEAEPIHADKFEKLLAKLYAELYAQQLRLPPGHTVPELDDTLELSRKVWQRTLAGREVFQRRRAKVERKAREGYQRELSKEKKKRLELLREFLKASREELKRARRAGCERDAASPGSLEAHLAILGEVLAVSFRESSLRAEVERQAPRLRRDLERLETVLGQCPADSVEPWLAESHQFSREVAGSLHRQLAQRAQLPQTRGD